MNNYVNMLFRDAASQSWRELAANPAQRESRRRIETDHVQFELIVRRLPPVEALEPESLAQIGE